MKLNQGSVLQDGKFRIIRALGQGGFGITYLAENTLLEKQVAIKEFFPKDFCGRDNTSHLTLGTQNNAETVEKLKARFLKEARNIAKLDHPGIVRIHDVFQENNTAYYVMDYIEGETLSEMVKRTGPLSQAKAIGYIRKVGEALEYIHSRQMTHFDVKPANIIVRRRDDMPMLIDFGLSKQYDSHGDSTSTLMQGVSKGYSPIELYNVGAITSFSPQTDIYSLAATLYYLLTATIPPSANSILENGLPLPSCIPSKLADAIRSAMAVSRTKRPASLAAWLPTLSTQNPVPTKLPVSATPKPAPELTPELTPEPTSRQFKSPTSDESTYMFGNNKTADKPSFISEKKKENKDISLRILLIVIAIIILMALFPKMCSVHKYDYYNDIEVVPVEAVEVVEETEPIVADSVIDVAVKDNAYRDMMDKTKKREQNSGLKPYPTRRETLRQGQKYVEENPIMVIEEESNLVCDSCI